MKNKENKEAFINNTGNNIFDKNNINNINIKNKESKKGRWRYISKNAIKRRS